MSVSKIYNGASWDTGVLRCYNGYVWLEKPNFYNGTVFDPLYASEVVTITTKNNPAFRFGATATAFVYWNSDGTTDYKDNDSAATQVHASTDWIIPNGSAPGTYRIRYTGMTGDTGFYTGTMSTVYSALTGSKYFAVYDNTASFGGRSVTATIQIDDGTTFVTSGSATVSADREDF